MLAQSAAGLPELLAAILPCTWSPGLIGYRWAADAADHPAYRDWLAFFASAEYDDIVDRMRARMAMRWESRLDANQPLPRVFSDGVPLEHGV